MARQLVGGAGLEGCRQSRGLVVRRPDGAHFALFDQPLIGAERLLGGASLSSLCDW